MFDIQKTIIEGAVKSGLSRVGIVRAADGSKKEVVDMALNAALLQRMQAYGYQHPVLHTVESTASGGTATLSSGGKMFRAKFTRRAAGVVINELTDVTIERSTNQLEGYEQRGFEGVDMMHGLPQPQALVQRLREASHMSRENVDLPMDRTVPKQRARREDGMLSWDWSLDD